MFESNLLRLVGVPHVETSAEMVFQTREPDQVSTCVGNKTVPQRCFAVTSRMPRKLMDSVLEGAFACVTSATAKNSVNLHK